MKCRECGVEIADKAIVCYRCGTSTTEPKFQPPAASPRRAFGVGATAIAMLILIAFLLFLQRTGSVDSSPTLRWALVGVAVVIVVLRGVARRSRR